MTWLAWRQLRFQALAAYVAVVAAAVVLAVTGKRIVALAEPAGAIFDRLTASDRTLFWSGLIVMAVLPALLGAFWGAPLVARELEHGTHRLVWVQSVTRMRWFGVKVGLTVLGAALAVSALTWAVTRWANPLDGATSATHGGFPSRLTPVSFAMRGIVPVSYAVFALALGITLGIVLRRSVPAMALTLLLYVAVQVAVPLWVRPHLAAPVDQSVTISRATLDGISSSGPGGPLTVSAHRADRGDWILSNRTVDASGRVAALPSWLSTCLPGPGAEAPPVSGQTRVPAPVNSLDSCFARLASEGYRQEIVYQPADRFWTLQWRESGLYLGLAAVVGGVGLWWLRERVS